MYCTVALLVKLSQNLENKKIKYDFYVIFVCNKYIDDIRNSNNLGSSGEGQRLINWKKMIVAEFKGLY
jgi:hypothetical protein